MSIKVLDKIESATTVTIVMTSKGPNEIENEGERK